ncbi:hypothetical protein, partial [Streptomyces sp. NPDC060188]|uniref:hypothetical protein n=1 Tax=Streptomyces sp. NPDC060188 TaxID=3347068 RepID=UPI003664CE43
SLRWAGGASPSEVFKPNQPLGLAGCDSAIYTLVMSGVLPLTQERAPQRKQGRLDCSSMSVQRWASSLGAGVVEAAVDVDDSAEVVSGAYDIAPGEHPTSCTD